MCIRDSSSNAQLDCAFADGTDYKPANGTDSGKKRAAENKEQCCALCSGASTKTLYSDISRTTKTGCPIFYLSYATNVGWICQFHSENATAQSSYDTASIAYIPM